MLKSVTDGSRLVKTNQKFLVYQLLGLCSIAKYA